MDYNRQHSRFFLIAGPCAIENRDMVLHTAETLGGVCTRLGIDLIFKSSYDKANRTSCSARGVGMDEGLRILQEVKEQLGLPILTDVHESWQCAPVAEVADILQIPAFLCRQTDLLQAAARTGRVVNVKKGQFLAPWDMRGAIDKCRAAGADNILLTERGSSFGYGRLVVDMTSLTEMRPSPTFPVWATLSITLTVGSRKMSRHTMVNATRSMTSVEYCTPR